MNDRKLSVWRIIFASLFVMSVFFFAVFGGVFLHLGSIGSLAVHSPALAVKDAPYGVYIVDSGRKRIVRTDSDGKADLLMTSGRNRFSEIYGLAVDAAGDIFVLDVIRDGRNRRIASEVVQKYPPGRRFPEEIFRIDHEHPTFDRSIAGLARNAEGGISFVTLEDERFVLHSHNFGEKAEAAWDFPMASKMFNSFDVGKAGKAGKADKNGEETLVLFTTRRGEIYKADDEGVERVFASAASTPWDAAVGDDGVLYFTDLARRGVFSVTSVTSVTFGEPELVYGDPDTIYYRVSAKSGFVAVSESGVIDLDSEEKSVIDEFSVNNVIFALRLCSRLAVLILLAGCVWGMVSLARFLIRKNDFVINFSAAVIVGTMLITAVFCLIVTKDITNRMTREMKSRLTNVAELVAMQIPADAFARLDSVSDYMNEDHSLISYTLEKIMSRAEYSEMYCVLYKILDGSVAEVFESDNDHGIVNYPYDWPLEGSDEMEILSTGQHKTYINPSWVDGGVIFSLCPVYGGDGEPIGLIEIGTALAAFRKETIDLILNLFLNVISVSVAMIIVVIELLVFVDGRRKTLSAAGSPLDVSAFRVPVDMVRSAVFLVYFITNVSTGFLPIYARELILKAGFSWSLPVEFLIAAPISADVFMGAIAALLGDWFVKKLGVRRTAIIGAAVIVFGACLAFAFYNFFTLTAGFAVCGFGCGLMLFLANLRVAGEEDPSEKDRGFAGFAVAMSSGINAGVVFGAFLTNWLSHQAVLGMAALTSLILLAFSCAYMTKLDSSLKLDRPDGAARETRETQKISAARFLFSPRVFSYFMALLGPAIVSGYFIIYLFPIVGFDFGISESSIGYAFLLNSLVVVFFSTMLTNVFSKKLGKTFSLCLWTLIYAGSFAMFAYFQNIPALLSVLVLMGFADCFGQSLSSSYYTELPEVEKYGQGKAIGVSNVVENAAQTVGPFVFSYVLHVGVGEGLLQVAGWLAVLSVVFLVGSALLRLSAAER
ncbi:MAG: MFS transporter [Synergistaceae bacterium]|nr:MFS transporter [Synergistaceae bacterium]